MKWLGNMSTKELGDAYESIEPEYINGESVEILGADNKWHDSLYVGQLSDGRHVVEINNQSYEGAFVRAKGEENE